MNGCEAEIACGRASAVISELESLTAEHPYREPLWAQLIIAYYLAERQSDALDAYRRFLALGATRPLPELYRAAGATLIFDPVAMRPLVDMVEEEMDRLRAMAG